MKLVQNLADIENTTAAKTMPWVRLMKAIGIGYDGI